MAPRMGPQSRSCTFPLGRPVSREAGKRQVKNSSLGRKPKTTVINELVYDGKDFAQKQNIAKQVNNHFCSSSCELASGTPDTVFQPEDFLNRTRFKCLFSPSKCRIHSLHYL